MPTLALHVFQDCYDLSLEALSSYSQAFPDSTLAANIQACNVFRLCDGKAALEVLESHHVGKVNDLILHNKCVFQDGDKALKVFPSLVGRVYEARLNLSIYYLKHGEVEAAAELMDAVEANCVQSHAVLGVLNAEIGQIKRCHDTLETAQSHFQSVGNSPTEGDTVLGRQCMASHLLLSKQYDDVLVYLGKSACIVVRGDQLVNNTSDMIILLDVQYKILSNRMLATTMRSSGITASHLQQVKGTAKQLKY